MIQKITRHDIYWHELPEGSYSVKITVRREGEEDALEFNTGAGNFRKVEVDGFIKATFDGAGLHFID